MTIRRKNWTQCCSSNSRLTTSSRRAASSSRRASSRRPASRPPASLQRTVLRDSCFLDNVRPSTASPKDAVLFAASGTARPKIDSIKTKTSSRIPQQGGVFLSRGTGVPGARFVRWGGRPGSPARASWAGVEAGVRDLVLRHFTRLSNSPTGSPAKRHNIAPSHTILLHP